jgi:hypothetical protein
VSVIMVIMPRMMPASTGNHANIVVKQRMTPSWQLLSLSAL